MIVPFEPQSGDPDADELNIFLDAMLATVPAPGSDLSNGNRPDSLTLAAREVRMLVRAADAPAAAHLVKHPLTGRWEQIVDMAARPLAPGSKAIPARSWVHMTVGEAASRTEYSAIHRDVSIEGASVSASTVNTARDTTAMWGNAAGASTSRLRRTYSTAVLVLCLLVGLGGMLVATPDRAAEPTALDYRPVAPLAEFADDFGPVADQLSLDVQLLDLPIPSRDMQVSVFGDILVSTNPGRPGARAFRLDDGTAMWEWPDIVMSQIASDGTTGLVLVIKRDGRAGLMQFDLATGTELWLTGLPILGSLALGEQEPVVIDGIIYLTDGNHAVYAIDAATGEIRWHAEIPADEMVATPQILSAQVVASGESIAVVMPGNRLVALSRESGTIQWEEGFASSLSAGDELVPSLAGDAERIYLTWGIMAPLEHDPSTYDVTWRSVMAFETATGERLWEAPGQGGTSLAIADDLLLVTSFNAVQVLHADDGTPAKPPIAYGTGDTSFGHVVQVSGAFAYLTATREEHLWVFAIRDGEIVQTWHATMSTFIDSESQDEFYPISLHSWRGGLLIRGSDGRLYHIPAAGAATPVAVAPVAAMAAVPHVEARR